MIEEMIEEAAADAAKDRLPNPHLLAYDMFKHMTSLTVLTLGGMLTLSGSIFAEVPSNDSMIIGMGLIAAAGVVAFMGQVEMVDWAHRAKGRPRVAARWGRGLMAALYGGGVGAFLATVLATLD